MNNKIIHIPQNNKRTTLVSHKTPPLASNRLSKPMFFKGPVYSISTDPLGEFVIFNTPTLNLNTARHPFLESYVLNLKTGSIKTASKFFNYGIDRIIMHGAFSGDGQKLVLVFQYRPSWEPTLRQKWNHFKYRKTTKVYNPGYNPLIKNTTSMLKLTSPNFIINQFVDVTNRTGHQLSHHKLLRGNFFVKDAYFLPNQDFLEVRLDKKGSAYINTSNEKPVLTLPPATPSAHSNTGSIIAYLIGNTIHLFDLYNKETIHSETIPKIYTGNNNDSANNIIELKFVNNDQHLLIILNYSPPLLFDLKNKTYNALSEKYGRDIVYAVDPSGSKLAITDRVGRTKIWGVDIWGNPEGNWRESGIVRNSSDYVFIEHALNPTSPGIVSSIDWFLEAWSIGLHAGPKIGGHKPKNIRFSDDGSLVGYISGETLYICENMSLKQVRKFKIKNIKDYIFTPHNLAVLFTAEDLKTGIVKI